MALPNVANLIAHWKMNDNAASTVVQDSMGSHNGTWQHGNTSTDTVTGMLNTALNFDGTNDYMTADDSDAFDVSTFTFCAWLRHNNTSVLWDRILSKKNAYTDSSGYEITLDGSNTDVLYTSGSSSTFATTPLGINWLNSEWVHLVVIYQGSTVKVYCNGVLKTTTGTIAPVVANALTFRLGKILTEDTTMWDGAMDDVRFYNIALTQDEVTSLYESGNGTEVEVVYPRPFVSFRKGTYSDKGFDTTAVRLSGGYAGITSNYEWDLTSASTPLTIGKWVMSINNDVLQASAITDVAYQLQLSVPRKLSVIMTLDWTLVNRFGKPLSMNWNWNATLSSDPADTASWWLDSSETVVATGIDTSGTFACVVNPLSTFKWRITKAKGMFTLLSYDLLLSLK